MNLRPATATAHSNIALIKYWGKSETLLNLPAVPSLSLTLDALTTTTRVEPDPQLTADRLELDGELVEGRERARVVALLDRVRQATGETTKAQVVSHNDFPTAAGLASSASGFAALAVAAAHAYDYAASPQRLSALARQSSASAARSLFGGFVNLLAQEEYAVALAPPEHWDLELIVAVTQAGRKPLGSTEAMEKTRAQSAYYPAWLAEAPKLHKKAEACVLERDFDTLGALMEQSTMMMHASMLAVSPAILFFTENTLSVIHTIYALRQAGLKAYFTIDAGPHVKVLVRAQDAAALDHELRKLASVKQIVRCRPGPGAQLKEQL